MAGIGITVRILRGGAPTDVDVTEATEEELDRYIALRGRFGETGWGLVKDLVRAIRRIRVAEPAAGPVSSPTPPRRGRASGPPGT